MGNDGGSSKISAVRIQGGSRGDPGGIQGGLKGLTCKRPFRLRGPPDSAPGGRYAREILRCVRRAGMIGHETWPEARAGGRPEVVRAGGTAEPACPLPEALPAPPAALGRLGSISRDLNGF